MPTINQDLYNALNGDLPNDTQTLNALNAIIESNNDGEFRQAIYNHRAIFGLNISEGPLTEENLSKEGKDDQGNVNADHSIDSLTRIAIEKRVFYAKEEINKLKDADLECLEKPESSNEVVDSYTHKFLGFTLAKIKDDNKESVRKAIRQYAAAELTIRNAKKADLSNFKQLNLLKERINTPLFPQSSKLFTTEQYRVQASLAETLIRNLPTDQNPKPDLNNLETGLMDLAKAGDEDRVKTALSRFGITNYDWLNPKTMEQIEKAACIRNIELDEGKSLPLGNENDKVHPALIHLIDKLPLAQQRALLEPAPNKILIALCHAQKREEVQRILNGSKVEPQLINNLVAENRNLARLARIANSEVANVLAQMKIDPPLTDRNIDLLNETIFKGISDYVEFSKAIISNIISLSPVKTINGNPKCIEVLCQAFGLSGEILPPSLKNTHIIKNPVVKDKKVSKKIEDQVTLNKNVADLYKAATHLDKVIYAEIAALSKAVVGEFTTQDVQELHDALTKATYEEFKVSIPKADVFDPSLTTQITPQRFTQIKIAIRQQKLLSDESLFSELEAQKKSIETIEKDFKELKTPTSLLGSSPLQRLKAVAQDFAAGDSSAVYWFNPAFQASSKENAKKFGPELIELSKTCDTMIDYLSRQIAKIDNEIKSLPPSFELQAGPQWKRDQIRARESELEQLKDRMKKELTQYETLQVLLKGDPNADETAHPTRRLGLLKVIEQAAEGKKDISLNSHQGYVISKDYPISEKANRLGKSEPEGWLDPLNPSVSGLVATVGGSRDNFEMVEKVKPGEFREYTVFYPTDKDNPANNPAKSSFIEEQGSGIMTLTCKNLPSNTEAKVDLAMKMAFRLIAAHGAPPSPKHPIKLSGSIENVGLLWTALKIISETDKNMRFDNDAILLERTKFNPKPEMGFFSGFSKSSLFEKHFKHHPAYHSYVNELKQVNELKFGNPKEELKTAVKDSKELMEFYKGKIQIVQSEKAVDDTLPPTAAPAA